MSDPEQPDDDTPAMPDLGSLLGGGEGGGLDLGGLMAQAQEMMASAQEAAQEVVEGSAGGGMVKVTVDGSLTFHSVEIHPSVVDPDDVEMLNDLVLAALRDAATQIQESQSDAMGGLDIGDLGGMFGGT